jgi:hypothetical protein
MVFPAVKLHQLYSLNLYDGLDIIFEDLAMINVPVLEKVAITKELGIIHIVNQMFEVNTHTKSVRILGNKINDTTFMVNKQGNGQIYTFNYNCSYTDILTGIEYLYHMYKNLVPS